MVQLRHPEEGRQVALVDGDRLRLLREFSSVYACAVAALQSDGGLIALVRAHASDREFDYAEVYAGRSPWRLLPAFDHPGDPARCLVTGTGLTHRKSADNRHAMHRGGQESQEKKEAAITDSMRIYLSGEEGGRPGAGEIGVQPEWFFKGTGEILRAHGEPLTVPAYAEDGGEEPEIAVVYLIDPGIDAGQASSSAAESRGHGQPWRVGFVAGNEFSDHRMESRNYLYLAHSKLRECAIGPELLISETLNDAPGEVRVERGGNTLWSQQVASGEANMVHSLENLEHHHFKYAGHRRPGDAHVHFLGTAGFSFGAGIVMEEGDVMEVRFDGLGRPLRNPIHFEARPPHLTHVRSLA
jgi:hypothetical protein